MSSNIFNDIKNWVTEHMIDDSDEQIGKMLLEEEDNVASSSNRKKRRHFKRDREAGHQRIFNDYFADNPVYPENIFRRRFRMSKALFCRIMEALENHSEFFRWRVDATGKKGLSPIQKCTAAIRQLAYGAPADHYDEYVRIGETTALNCLHNFCKCVIEIFKDTYLRSPTSEDIQRLLHLHSQHHGFPGMLGSIDCMHWHWRNCPVAWKGQFTRGDQGVPTIMLEAVASADLWIWHAFFGVAGSNNDINVLNQSPLFNDVLSGRAPDVRFEVNGTTYTKGYYLADGIYPEWATFVKSFSYPEDPKRLKFKQMQEAARKDVERAFGVLQSRWAIVRGPARFWYKSKLAEIMYTCIILHNMIVEDEGDAITNWGDDEGEPSIPVSRGPTQEFQQYLRRHAELRDQEVHHRLRSDLVEYIWNRFGGSEDEN